MFNIVVRAKQRGQYDRNYRMASLARDRGKKLSAFAHPFTLNQPEYHMVRKWASKTFSLRYHVNDPQCTLSMLLSLPPLPQLLCGMALQQEKKKRTVVTCVSLNLIRSAEKPLNDYSVKQLLTANILSVDPSMAAHRAFFT